MKFRHKVERININGLKEFSVQYFLCDEIFIGRGTGCRIRLASRLVGVRHARLIDEVNGGIVIESVESGYPVLVNGKETERAVLKDGDSVMLGDVTFRTFFDGDYWGFHEVRQETIEEDKTEVVKRHVKRLDLSRFYPSFTSLSLLLMLIIGLIFFVNPYKGYARQRWNSGPISNGHKLFENDCLRCHAVPFTPVRDAECMSCHRMSQHAERMPVFAKNHPDRDLRCASCHGEHRGERAIKEERSLLCVSCHANLPQLMPNTEHPPVRSLALHPQFRVSILDYTNDPEKPDVKRVSLDDTEHLVDTTRIKLNHAKHLQKGLRGVPEGKNHLFCTDCHEMMPDRKNIRPISFDKNCRSCHSLGFDDRLPTLEVPHGNADVVYNFIYAEYAKLFLAERPQSERMDLVRRFKPGATVIKEPDIQFTREFVEQESRTAEKTLYTKTACLLCHVVAPREGDVTGKSAFIVQKPNIPVRWLPLSVFNHGSHQEVTCESCHMKARKSELTSDVLLPTVKLCRTCHVDGSKSDHTSTTCVSCHSYHDKLLLTDAEKQPIREILLHF